MFRVESYILRYVQKHEGITYHLYKGRARHKTGYYVSFKDYGDIIHLSVFTGELIWNYIQDHYFILDSSSSYLGIWIDKGIVYLDISRWVKGKNDALELGKREEQKTIWDCKNKIALRVI